MINAVLILVILVLAYVCFWLLLIILKYKADIIELEDRIMKMEGVEVWW